MIKVCFIQVTDRYFPGDGGNKDGHFRNIIFFYLNGLKYFGPRLCLSGGRTVRFKKFPGFSVVSYTLYDHPHPPGLEQQKTPHRK